MKILPDSAPTVLSLRLPQSLKDRLEFLKDVYTQRFGSPHTVSDVARLIIQGHHDVRTESLELLREPTASLQQIRAKAEHQLLLSQAEWGLIAYYCQKALESGHHTLPCEISQASLITLLKAFQAIYPLRRGSTGEPAAYFRGNLLWNYNVDSDAPMGGRDDLMTVLAANIELHREQPPTGTKNTLLGRNLFILLDRSEFLSVQALNDALLPLWKELWLICARGHYLERKQPIRAINPVTRQLPCPPQEPLPLVSHNGFHLSFINTDGGEISLFWTLLGPHSPTQSIGSFPIMSELRYILNTFRPTECGQHFTTRYFSAYSSQGRTEPITISLRFYDYGVTYAFSSEQWISVRELFQLAFESRVLASAWESLEMEYGAF